MHRIARQFRADLVGRTVAASSPQGRFAAGAALLDGTVATSAVALGKHLLVGFGDAGGDVVVPGAGPADRWLHVHLGLYGAWDLHGHVTPLDGSGPQRSLGAPRRSLRMGEGEIALATPEDFPPPPVGQVRLRLATEHTVADLRGPITCEVVDDAHVARIVAGAGPDPQVEAWPDAEAEVVRRIRSRRVPVGQLLMDQSVVSGIGNVYRAEILHRAGLEPHTPGARVPEEVVVALWRDWVDLLEDGIRSGVMVTRRDLDEPGRALALADPAERHAVYRRAGEPCRTCGTPVLSEAMAGRTLYWCPRCQS